MKPSKRQDSFKGPERGQGEKIGGKESAEKAPVEQGSEGEEGGGGGFGRPREQGADQEGSDDMPVDE